MEGYDDYVRSMEEITSAWLVQHEVLKRHIISAIEKKAGKDKLERVNLSINFSGHPILEISIMLIWGNIGCTPDEEVKKKIVDLLTELHIHYKKRWMDFKTQDDYNCLHSTSQIMGVLSMSPEEFDYAVLKEKGYIQTGDNTSRRTSLLRR